MKTSSDLVSCKENPSTVLSSKNYTYKLWQYSQDILKCQIRFELWKIFNHHWEYEKSSTIIEKMFKMSSKWEVQNEFRNLHRKYYEDGSPDNAAAKLISSIYTVHCIPMFPNYIVF